MPLPLPVPHLGQVVVPSMHVPPARPPPLPRWTSTRAPSLSLVPSYPPSALTSEVEAVRECGSPRVEGGGSSNLLKAAVGDPMGTRYLRGWRVWGDLRPNTGGGCGWRVIFTLVGGGCSCAPHRIFYPLPSLVSTHNFTIRILKLRI
jgi:hypothetical protein